MCSGQLKDTSRYPVEYPLSFVLGGKKIFRSGEGKGLGGGGGGGGGGEGKKNWGKKAEGGKKIK